MAALYADENFPHPVVVALGSLGHDVLTAQQAGLAYQAVPDPDQLAFAIAQGRALITRNRRHFIRLHQKIRPHCGIIVCSEDPAFLAQPNRFIKHFWPVPISTTNSSGFTSLEQVRVLKPALASVSMSAGTIIPEGHTMWMQKCTRDDRKGVISPIPTQIVSNEEFFPLPQTPDQKRVESRIKELGTRFGKVLGMSRRQFLATAGGMAAAFLAMNEVFGPYFEVEAAEPLDAALRDEKWPKDQFIFDIQCHHVDVPRGRGKGVLVFRQQAERFNPALKGHKHKHEDLGIENFIKEIFFDSDTVMGVISGIPQKPDQNILPVERMVETKNKINALAGSQRMVTHGLVAPNLKEYNRDDMQRQAEDLKIDAWKMYTGLFFGKDQAGPWWMDDEKIAYPMFEVSKKVKVKNVCVHKGLPLFGFNEEHCHPKDIKKAASDFPDLNFIIYHSGFRALRDGAETKREKFLEDKKIDWVTDLCEMRKANPKLTNVYMELGSTFGMTVVVQPLITGHILGQILDAFGEDHILWGTDSIWWGSPQWQIEALRRFQMPQELIDKYGYKPLTKEIKDKVLGLNAARVYGIDVKAKRQAIPKDYLSKLKASYRHYGGEPSLAAYGWVPREA